MADVDGDDGGLERRAGDPQVVQRLFDALPLMLLDAEGPENRVVAVTAVYRSYVGRQEFIGMPLREAFPEVMGQQVRRLHRVPVARRQRERARAHR